MISTKGYFYFDHLNPKHNVKTRKHSKMSSTGFPLREIPVQMSKQEQTNITGITGTSYNRRFIDQQQVDLYPRVKRRSQYRLTFQKLQQILNDSNGEWLTKTKIQANPEQNEHQFYVKNSRNLYSSGRHVNLRKTPKNKQLKDCLFKRDDTKGRSKTSMSSGINKNQSLLSEQLTMPHKQRSEVKEVREEVAICPSMSGVFIPSSNFKSRKNSSSRRYKTSYNM